MLLDFYPCLSDGFVGEGNYFCTAATTLLQIQKLFEGSLDNIYTILAV